MKKFKKILATALFLIMIVSFSIATNATESTFDGLEISLNTKQEEYEKGEKISLDLSIKNTNTYSVVLTNIENSIPEGFKVDTTSLEELKNYELKVGEVVHVTTELSEANQTIAKSPQETGDVNTGDTSNVEGLLMLVSVSATILVLIKFKSSRKSAILLLTLGISMTSSFIIIQAKDISNIANIEKEVLYDGKNIKVISTITYNYSSPDPKDPVEYQDGIEETKLDYTLDEDQKKITTSSSEEIKNWTKGEIHVLKHTSNPIDDIAICIESIEQLDDGTMVIMYSTPNIMDVIKSIDYEGINMKDGIIIPADGVTFSEANMEEENARSMLVSPFSADIEEKGYMKLFGKKSFDYDKGGIKFSGELNLKRLNYDFEMDLGFIPNIKKAYVTLDSSITLGMELNHKGEKKLKLASIEAPIGYGFSAIGDIYCYFSADGELILEYTISTISGFDYDDGNFKGIWEMNNKLSKAKADVNLKVGATAEPKIELLKLGLIGGEFDYGRHFELKLDEISLDPLEYCIDGGYYNYASVSTILLPGTWNKTFTASLFGKGEDPNKKMLHIEEGRIVDECTRKYGSLEGKVLKKDGENLEPLNLAKILLYKNGEVQYQTESRNDGTFRFGKEIEKGTYEIVVRSEKYETYKGTVVIKGNYENKIEEAIVLNPFADSIHVSGTIYDKANNKPITGATVSVKGYVDRTTETDSEGNYFLEVPKGKQEIVATAKNYSTDAFVSDFTDDVDNINIFLTKQYNKEVLTIHAGESYQFDFNSDKRIFVIAEQDSEYSAYLNGSISYHEPRVAGDVFYRGVEDGHHWEIKVFKGSLTVYASDGGFYDEPDTNLSAVGTYANMNGLDPFIDMTIKAGTSKTFDNQVDSPKNKSFVIYCYSNEIVNGTETVVDYYYNTHFDWEISEDVYDLNGKINFWRPINNLEKVTLTVNSGSMIVYFYRLDKISVY